MKKIVAGLALATLLTVSTAAQALDIGVTGNRDFAGNDRNSLGLTVGQKFGSIGLQVGVERFQRGNDQDRWSLIGSYDVVKFGKVATLSAKGGAAYLNNRVGADGYAWVAGVGLDVPLTKTISWTVDYRHQWGQNRVEQFNGNTIGTGIKFTF